MIATTSATAMESRLSGHPNVPHTGINRIHVVGTLVCPVASVTPCSGTMRPGSLENHLERMRTRKYTCLPTSANSSAEKLLGAVDDTSFG